MFDYERKGTSGSFRLAFIKVYPLMNNKTFCSAAMQFEIYYFEGCLQ